jgi:hypothetical protein
VSGTQLENLAVVLGHAMAEWSERDRAAGATASQVRAGNTAVAAIDDMLAVLHRMRGQMVAERRADQDIQATRADAMLAEARARRSESERPEAGGDRP